MVGTERYSLICVLLAGGLALCAAAVGMSPLSASSPYVGEIQQSLDNLDSRQYVKAEQEALALASHPTCPMPRAWAVVAAARQRQGQYASASRAYRLFLASTESPAMRDYALQQIEACRRAAEPPAMPVAPGSKLDRDARARLAEVHDETYTESTEHFIVRARNPELARLVAAEAEVSLERICRVILAGQDYPHSVRINVWPDHDTYLAHAADAPEWSGGSFRFFVQDGLVTRQIDLTQRDAEKQLAVIMLDRVLPHELCHLVLREYFGDAACPLFLNEGLAMMAEYEPEAARIELAGKVVAGQARIALAALLVRRRYDLDRPGVFYAEAFSFVEFLHGRITPRQFKAFLRHVKDGCTIADALQRSLYAPADEEFLASLASAWEDHALAQSQYIRALAAAGR